MTQIPFHQILIWCSILFSFYFTYYLYNQWIKTPVQQPQQPQQRQQNQNKKIIQNIQKEKELYQNELNNIKKQTSNNNINQYFKLFHLYYNGVPDKYDLNGNKISGIEPNPGKAIWYLQRCIDLGFNRGWILMGDIYQHGMYNMNPDWKKAKILYEKTLKTDQWLDGIDKLEQIGQKIEKSAVYNWLNLSEPEYENNHKKYHETKYKNPKHKKTNNTYFSSPKTKMNTNELFRANDINNAIIQNFRDNRHNFNNQPTQMEFNVDSLTYNDAHNSHNSQVIATVKKSLQNLKENTDITMNLPQSMKNIRDYLKGQLSCDKTNDALKSLDSIEKNISPLTLSDMKESDALSLVWNRIHNDVNKDNSETLKENLLSELAEMQEHGKSVCATGRFTRIVDTLNAVDPDVTIKPTYIINEEMMTKSADIRNKMIDDMAENEKEKYNKGTHSKQDELDEKLKKNIKDTLYNDYVKSDIMTESKFESEVNKWIDEI
jgi:hypothetical protein